MKAKLVFVPQPAFSSHIGLMPVRYDVCGESAEPKITHNFRVGGSTCFML